MPPTPKSRNPKAVENRLRLAAQRQGLQVVRLPKPDPLIAPGGDKWIVVDPPTGQVLSPTMDLEGLEHWVMHPAQRARVAPLLAAAAQ